MNALMCLAISMYSLYRCEMSKIAPCILLILSVCLLSGCNTTGTAFAPIECDEASRLGQMVRPAGKDAWVAKGINNAREDKVTRKNLLGVLYTVLYNDGSEPSLR